MASRTEGDRPSQKLTRFPRLARDSAALAPVPDIDDHGGLFDESTAVARYDAVTTQVAIAELAPLLAAAQPTRMVPALVRPAAMATGSVVSRRSAASLPLPRRRRWGLAVFVFLTLVVTWGVVAYEVWSVWAGQPR